MMLIFRVVRNFDIKTDALVFFLDQMCSHGSCVCQDIASGDEIILDDLAFVLQDFLRGFHLETKTTK